MIEEDLGDSDEGVWLLYNGGAVLERVVDSGPAFSKLTQDQKDAPALCCCQNCLTQNSQV